MDPWTKACSEMPIQLSGQKCRTACLPRLYVSLCKGIKGALRIHIDCLRNALKLAVGICMCVSTTDAFIIIIAYFTANHYPKHALKQDLRLISLRQHLVLVNFSTALGQALHLFS